MHVLNVYVSCFRGGGGRSDGWKIVWTTFFLVLNLYYSLQRGSNGFVTEKTILLQGSRGAVVQYFPGDCPTFSRGGGGDQMLISIETHITCDFPGGGEEVRNPYQPSESAHACIIELLGHCKGGNFKIHIWAWFGYFICSRREIRFYLSGKSK